MTPQQHGIRRLFESCNGVLTLAVLTAEIARRPLTGDPAADHMKSAATVLMRQIAGRDRTHAAACVLCVAPLWHGSPPAAVGVLLPFGLSGEHDVIAAPICTRCAAGRSQAELVRSVLSMLPGSRALPPPVNGVGHA